MTHFEYYQTMSKGIFYSTFHCKKVVTGGKKTDRSSSRGPWCSRPQAGYSCSNGARLNPRICVCRAGQLRAARKKADIVSEASLCLIACRPQTTDWMLVLSRTNTLVWHCNSSQVVKKSIQSFPALVTTFLFHCHDEYVLSELAKQPRHVLLNQSSMYTALVFIAKKIRLIVWLVSLDERAPEKCKLNFWKMRGTDGLHCNLFRWLFFRLGLILALFPADC